MRIPTAKWFVSLSNGETLYEDKGDFMYKGGKDSPWSRLFVYVNDLNVQIDAFNVGLKTVIALRDKEVNAFKLDESSLKRSIEFEINSLRASELPNDVKETLAQAREAVLSNAIKLIEKRDKLFDEANALNKKLKVDQSIDMEERELIKKQVNLNNKTIQQIDGYCFSKDRLLKVLKPVEITSLGIYTDDGIRRMLPSGGSVPHFHAFFNTEKPKNLSFFRRYGKNIKSSMSTSEDEKEQFFAVAEADYGDKKLQIWVDDDNPKNSWSLVL